MGEAYRSSQHAVIFCTLLVSANIYGRWLKEQCHEIFTLHLILYDLMQTRFLRIYKWLQNAENVDVQCAQTLTEKLRKTVLRATMST